MKAIKYEKYGSPEALRTVESARPVPKENEVLIKVRAASLNAADTILLRGKPFLVRMMTGGITRPKHKTLGADVAGIVEAVGEKAVRFKPDDEVYGDLSGCGWGGLAEYAVADESVLCVKPAGMTFEQAAAVPMAAVTALQSLRDKGGLQAGQTVLINGASGGVGSFAVQIAKAYGALVTAVCGAGKTKTTRSLGADHVIDYTKEDFTKNREQFDLIFDTAAHHTLSDIRRVLEKTGTYVVAGGALAKIMYVIFFGGLLSRKSGRRFKSITARPASRDLELLNAFFASGQVVPVVDKAFPFEKAADAFRYFAERKAVGKIVIKMNG